MPNDEITAEDMQRILMRLYLRLKELSQQPEPKIAPDDFSDLASMVWWMKQDVTNVLSSPI